MGTKTTIEVRSKPSSKTNWMPGRWRQIDRTRVTNDRTDCRGGGVPMGATVYIYSDPPKNWFESTWDFDWNLEVRETK